MACDIHVHYVPEEIAKHTAFFQGIWQDKDRLKEYLGLVEFAHIVPAPNEAYEKLGWDKFIYTYNQKLLELKEEFKEKVLLSGLVNIEKSATAKEQVIALKEQGFSSLSFASSYQGHFRVKEMRPFLEAAAALGLAVFIHPQIINPIGYERVKDPLLMPVLEYSFDVSILAGLLMMDGILQEISGLKIVVSSLGGVIAYLADRFDGVYSMLRQRGLVKDLGNSPTYFLKKIWVDTAGVKSLGVLNLARDFFGEDKLLFASDYPVGQKTDFLESISWGRKLLRDNFMALFGL